MVSGSVFVPAANSAGGVAFATPGEVAGETYTISFDFQFVHGTHPWLFADESGSGDINGLTFDVPNPGDNCWHHYTYTAPVSAAKGVLFVYQANAGPEEMRIDNMTLEQASPGARIGLWSSGPENCACRLAP